MTTEISDPIATTANDPEVGSAVQIRHELVTDDGAPDPAAGLHGTIAGRDPFGHFMIKIGSRKPASFARHAFIVTAAPTSQKDQNAPVWEYPQDMHVQAPGISTETEAVRLVTVPPLQAINSPTNPRRRRGLDVDSLRALADSILAHGLGNPILVRPLPASRLEETAGMDPRPAYEVIAGERRWRAAQLADLPTMPMVVRHMDDQAVLEMQLVENIEREDLDPMEEAEGFQLLREKLGYTVEQIADKMGKGRGPSYVRKRMKLLDLTPESREAMYDGTLSLSTGIVVAKYPPERQAKAVQIIKAMETKGADGKPVPAPFRTVVLELYRKLNTIIKIAAFDTADPGLVLTAGPCSTCRKRTRADEDLFAEATDAGEDSCLDTACWESKTAAHVQRIHVDAKARGLQVIDGDEAVKVVPSPYSSHRQGYVPLEDYAYTEEGPDGKEREVTYADALRAQGRKAPKPVVLINPHTAKAEEVIPVAVAEKLLPQQVQQARADRVQQAKVQAQQEEDATPPEWRAMKDPAVRRAALLRAFDVIASRDRTIDDLRLMALNAWECEPELTEQWLGWTDEIEGTDIEDLADFRRQKLLALDASQLASAITMACLEYEVTSHVGGWKYLPSNDRATQALQAYGIDILAVRDKVQEDLQRQQGNPDGEAIGDDQDDAGDNATDEGDE